MSNWILAFVCLACVSVHVQPFLVKERLPNTIKKFNFASYYDDHMVLQKAPKRAVIWGYSQKLGDAVTVTVSGKGSVNTTVTTGPVPGQPVWVVQLPPVDAGGPYDITATSSSEGSVGLTDVLFGDVWVCSGQSNMEFTVDMVFNASSELDEVANYKNIRVFTVMPGGSKSQQFDLITVEQYWDIPTKKSIGYANWKYFSAVCWLYGKYLSDHLKYPIGLIASSYGGTRVEAWSSPDALAACGLKPDDRFSHANYGSVNPNAASVLWNDMIHPFLNMTIYGAIWYQGEANANPPPGFPDTRDIYNCTFPAMIDDWRRKFHQGSLEQTDELFPFGFVQLAAYRNKTITSGFPDIRWHQTADTGTVPNPRMRNVFMAVAMDLPDFSSPWSGIHPRDKQDVAKRLVLSGLAVAYKQSQIVYQGPLPKLFILYIANDTLKIQYNEDTNVLDVRSTDGFDICCMNLSDPTECHSTKATWYPVTMAAYDESSVTINFGKICQKAFLAAVRYAWRESPCPFKACAIYDKSSSLPGPPFVKYILDDKPNVKCLV